MPVFKRHCAVDTTDKFCYHILIICRRMQVSFSYLQASCGVVAPGILGAGTPLEPKNILERVYNEKDRCDTFLYLR